MQDRYREHPKFVLRATGLDLPVSLVAQKGAKPKDIFERAIRLHDIRAESAWSFFNVSSYHTADGVAVRRGELIYEVRNLPELPVDAAQVFSYHFGFPDSLVSFDVSKFSITEEAQEPLRDLIQTGLIEVDMRGSTATIRQTDLGRSYPRIRLDWECMRNLASSLHLIGSSRTAYDPSEGIGL